MVADIEFDHAALARLVENAADAIVIVDGTGAIRFANAAVLDVFGYEEGWGLPSNADAKRVLDAMRSA